MQARALSEKYILRTRSRHAACHGAKPGRQKYSFTASWITRDAFSVDAICPPEELLMVVDGLLNVG